MAWTIEDLAALDKAIASGTKSVKHGETQVTYQDMNAMIDARNLMLDDLATQGLLPGGNGSGGTRYFGRTVAKYNSGLR